MAFFDARRVRLLLLGGAVLVLATVYGWLLLTPAGVPPLIPHEHTEAPPIPLPHTPPEPLA